SSPSVSSVRRALSNVIVTSARPWLRRVVEPLKITSAISPPRKLLALCSPSTQRTPSTMLLFPDPFGPTIAVMPLLNSNWVLSAKLLKPINSRRLSMNPPQSMSLIRSQSQPWLAVAMELETTDLVHVPHRSINWQWAFAEKAGSGDLRDDFQIGAHGIR